MEFYNLSILMSFIQHQFEVLILATDVITISTES